MGNRRSKLPSGDNTLTAQTYMILGITFLIISFSNIAFLSIGLVFIILSVTLFPEVKLFDFASLKKSSPAAKKKEEASDNKKSA